MTKKNVVKELIKEENIDILCLQETELDSNLNHDLLSFPQYCFESEINNDRSRVGIYIRDNINYIRRTDLEGDNNHIVVLDVESKRKLRLITIYRPFNPRDGVQPRQFFENQLNLINQALTNNTIIMGDFNLDWNKKDMQSYQFNSYFDLLDEKILNSNLIQIVENPTWSRIVNGTLRESLLDHIYVNDVTLFNEASEMTPYFGDHKMVYCTYNDSKHKPTYCQKRNWMHYNKEELVMLLSQIPWEIKSDSVQDAWNEIEYKLINIIDRVAPVEEFTDYKATKTIVTPSFIIAAKNKRKKLLSRLKTSRSPEIKDQIKTLDSKIRSFYHKRKTNDVRRSIIPGNTSSLWKAVNVAKDVHKNTLPKTLFKSNEQISPAEVPESFAKFFDDKIKHVLEETMVDDTVYNGVKKVNAESKFFMTPSLVRECICSLKTKNTEGYDRIPQRILVDGADILVEPLSVLFHKIYHEKTIPGQWLISKTIPVFKNKGEKKNIENYRPIANLCSTSKVFEKLILKRILEIQDQNECDLTGINQHGFKRGKSTSTLSLEIQNIIARALDEDKSVLLASLDLSAAFDVVNIELLIKRMQIVGLPQDVIDLVEIWLKNRMFYVSIDGVNSCLYDLLLGTVQGSILGPVLYAIFVSPVFDLEKLFAFADDKFVPKIGDNLPELVKTMEDSIEAIRTWIKKSGLKINENKTEICLFNKKDTPSVYVKVGDDSIKSNDVINVLGVLFDSKLCWSPHIKNAISKSSKALNALRIIRKYFTSKELLQLVTSNYYSILYYNSEIWNVHSLKQFDKKLLLTASAKALKLATHFCDPMISYDNLHVTTNRATPSMYCDYKLSLLLYKTYNMQQPEEEWIIINFTQTLMSRQVFFHVNKNNRLRIGLNSLCNRFHYLNNKIPLEWLNYNYLTYKMQCKKLFLTHK